MMPAMLMRFEGSAVSICFNRSLHATDTCTKTRQAGRPNHTSSLQNTNTSQQQGNNIVRRVKELTLGGRMKSALMMRPNISCMRRTPFTCARSASDAVILGCDLSPSSVGCTHNIWQQ